MRKTAPSLPEQTVHANLHAKLLQRVVMGNVVIDHETVTRTFAHGSGQIDLVCIYQIKDELIQTASFVFEAPSAGLGADR